MYRCTMMQRSLNHRAEPGTDDRLSMENVKYRSVRRTFRKGRKFNLFALMYRRKCAGRYACGGAVLYARGWWFLKLCRGSGLLFMIVNSCWILWQVDIFSWNKKNREREVKFLLFFYLDSENSSRLITSISFPYHHKRLNKFEREEKLFAVLS